MSTAMETSRMTVETEVVAKARRRRFTAAENLRVLREADGCTKPGEVGALLRREGLYSRDHPASPGSSLWPSSFYRRRKVTDESGHLVRQAPRISSSLLSL